MLAKSQDAFVIVCTIHPSPTTLKPQVWTPRQLIPKTLLDTVGSLLDDPSYSDVEFVIAKRRHNHSNIRTIYACKKMLRRADYFETSISTSKNVIRSVLTLNQPQCSLLVLLKMQWGRQTLK